MARRFRMKAGFQGALSLPGLPGLRPGVVVEGDEYARFCPAILEEVRDAAPPPPPSPTPAAPPKPTKPPTLSEPPVLPDAPEDKEDDEGDEDDGDDPVPDMSWRKSDLIAYADGAGLAVEGLTKAQILEEIKEWRG